MKYCDAFKAKWLIFLRAVGMNQFGDMTQCVLSLCVCVCVLFLSCSLSFSLPCVMLMQGGD
jgi:hypothetical protein